MSINKCPPGNVQSFPINARFDVTDTTFIQAKKKPLNIKFNWGTRTTAPNFSYATSGIIDHTQNDYSTTLMFNGSLYTLASVQITAPSHNNWLTPSSLEAGKLDNNEDIMITFQRDMYAPDSQVDPYIIILVNPILRNRSQDGNPLYLTNMANQIASPATLESIFPYISTNTYAYYTTCVNGLTSQDPYKNVLVMLNVNGMPVSSELMIKIKDMYNKFSEGSYPAYIPLGNFNTKSNPNDYISGIREGFASATASTTQPGVPLPNTGSGAPTNRFNVDKCVPFDPETQLGSDGVVVLNDLRRVEFTDVIKQRVEVKYDWLGRRTGTLKLTDIETGLVYTVIIIGILFLIYMVYFFTFNPQSEMNPAPGKFTWWSGLEFLLTRLGILIAGFLIGIYTIPADCPK